MTSASQELTQTRPKRLVLTCFFSPGDTVMLTAAVRDLHLAYPGQFLTDVRATAMEIWENNPYITPLDENDSDVESIEMHYPLINTSNTAPYHFVHGFTHYLEDQLGLRIPMTPDILTYPWRIQPFFGFSGILAGATGS